MRPRDILAANVNRLIAANPRFKSPAELVKASGLSSGTIGRIRLAQVATTMDHLEGLAKAFGVEPWELMAPPDCAPAMRAVAEAIRSAAESSAPPSTTHGKRAGARPLCS
jgi:transcriptional regulator with XRE-family HTH domain